MRISDWSSDVCSSDLGFTQIAQEGSQFLHMLNHLVGNRDIEPPRRITPTGIPRDDANARLPIDTGMARGQQINGCGPLAIILEPMLSDVEAMHHNRPPRPMFLAQSLRQMHPSAIPAPNLPDTPRTAFNTTSTPVP